MNTEPIATFNYNDNFRVEVTPHPERDSRVLYATYRRSERYGTDGWVQVSGSWQEDAAAARRDAFEDIDFWHNTRASRDRRGNELPADSTMTIAEMMMIESD